MALTGTDLLLVGRGAVNYRVTGTELAAFVVANGLPSQAGNAGKVLSTDGSALSWITVGGTGTVTSVTGAAPIVVATGTTTPAISINAATTTTVGSIQIATLADAAAGTLATSALTPESGVPKNASGMTGAAILPGGTTAQQPAGAADGWFRYNSTLKVLEYYTNSAWLPIVAGGGTTGGVTIMTAATAPATRPNGTALVAGDLYYNTATEQYFSWNGTDWVPFDQRDVVVTATGVTAKANDYIVVTAATQTITLPATPIKGTCVTIVVAGTWLDTVVAQNGSNIMGLAQDLTLDKQYAAMQFTYTDATNGWRLN
jgi:hypothetical protein